MKHLFTGAKHFALNAPAVRAGGNNNAVQPARNAGNNQRADNQQEQEDDEMVIMDNFEMPAGTRGGVRGSKFWTDKVANTIEKLLLHGKKGQAVIIPPMDMGKVAKPLQRQRTGTKWRIDEWLKGLADADAVSVAEGNASQFTMPNYTIAVVDTEKAKGIAVRKDG